MFESIMALKGLDFSNFYQNFLSMMEGSFYVLILRTHINKNLSHPHTPFLIK